jgi:Ca2+-transporting ATPase
LAHELGADPEAGLPADKVADKRQQFGDNALTETEKTGWLGHLFKQFQNPLVLILLLAGIVTVAIGHVVDTSVIFVALLVNVTVGTIQEDRASNAFAALEESQSKEATVVRGGKKQVIPAESVVVGDIITLASGIYVPADARVLKEDDLSLNEAALTGEWMEVEKDSATLSEDKTVPNRSNMVWKGTLVSSGKAKAVVTSVGDNTEVGKIAAGLEDGTDTTTPIQKHMKRLAQFVAVISVVAVAVIFVLGLVRGQPLVEMLVFSIAVAVSVVPEGLPAAVTVVLALGMEHILDRGGLVKNLRAAETLGSTTTILTDKTGTLTEAKMAVDELVVKEDTDRSDQKALSPLQLDLLNSALSNSHAFIETTDDGSKVIRGEPMEKALVRKSQKADLAYSAVLDKRLDALAFDSENQFAASVTENETGQKLIISGAPEVVLDKSEKEKTGSGVRALTDSRQKELRNLQKAKSRQGKRLIAIAKKETQKETVPREESDEGQPAQGVVNDLVFVGIIAFVDPVRENVARDMKRAKSAGVNVVMVTGDNPETAGYIARQAGVAEADPKPVTGSRLAEMSDKQILEAVQNRNVFARVLPEQKLRIGKLLHRQEEVVAMTGDGVNDAPALRQADIGVAVGSGTDVAKEASDLVLLDDSFSIIVAAIEEGRRIIDNLKKIIAHLLSTSFGGVFLIGGALIFGLPLPILTPQILWVNIVEGGLLTFVFAAEPPAPDVMERDPSSTRSRNLVSTPIKWLVAASGTITGIAAFVIYVVLSAQSIPLETVRTMMFVILTIDALFFTVALKDFYKPIHRITFSNNTFLFVSMFLSLTALGGAIFIPPLRNLLSLTTLSGVQWLFLAGVGLFDLLVVELAKYRLFQRPVS